MVTDKPERKLNEPKDLKLASGETMLVLEEGLLDLTLGCCALRICEFVAENIDEFIPEMSRVTQSV
jgi:hypothetical protein